MRTRLSWGEGASSASRSPRLGFTVPDSGIRNGAYVLLVPGTAWDANGLTFPVDETKSLEVDDRVAMQDYW
jgi:hypothetical protein